MRHSLLFALLVVFASLTPTLRAQAVPVQVPALEDLALAAKLYLPDGDIFEAVPGVMVAYDSKRSPAGGTKLVAALRDRGWAVLTFDTSGYVGHDALTSDPGCPDLEPDFFRHGLKFLKAHDAVDAARLGVIGGEVSGNYACMAVARQDVLGGVSFHAQADAVKGLGQTDLTHLRSMLYIASEQFEDGRAPAQARELAGLSSGASRALIVDGSSAISDVLLTESPELITAIVDHLGGVLAAGKSKKIEFPAADGLVVTADMYGPHPVDHPWIIVAHQAGWSRGEYRETAPRLTTLGFNVIALDQRSGGGVNDVPNETAARAKEAKLAAGFLDAEPDILAALAWARELGARKTLLVGSSYSASLALKIAGEHPELVTAVASFSPGEYFGKDRPKLVETAAARIKCPAFITSAKREGDAWAKIFEAISGEAAGTKQGFLPAVEGQHGSRALWSKFEGSAVLWDTFSHFLLRQR